MNILVFNSSIEIIGTILGLIYVYFQYKVSPKLWLACLISAVPLLYLNFYKGYLATSLLYLYYLSMAIWKLANASEKTQKADVLQIARVPRRQWLGIGVATLLIFGLFFVATQTGFFGLLKQLSMPTQDTPVTIAIADSLATTLCFIGMWLLSKNYLEQWYAWITADVLFLYMYLDRNNYMLAGLMVFYIIVSIVGWQNWLSLYKQQSQAE